MGTFRSTLSDLGACSEAVQWVGDRSAVDAWNECERRGWMLWGVVRVGGEDVSSKFVEAIARHEIKRIPASHRSRMNDHLNLAVSLRGISTSRDSEELLFSLDRERRELWFGPVHVWYATLCVQSAIKACLGLYPEYNVHECVGYALDANRIYTDRLACDMIREIVPAEQICEWMTGAQ